MKKATRNWIDGAKYDLKTAKSIFKGGRNVYSVFMCHLAVEKMLKAKITEFAEKMPPKTHDLLLLLRLSGLEVPKENQVILQKLSGLSVPIRYSDDFRAIHQSYSRKEMENIIAETERMIKWLEKQI
jgi:HEPN domain-containing protein